MRRLGFVSKVRTEPGASCGVASKAGGRRDTPGISSPYQRSQTRRRELLATGGLLRQNPGVRVWCLAAVLVCVGVEPVGRMGRRLGEARHGRYIRQACGE